MIFNFYFIGPASTIYERQLTTDQDIPSGLLQVQAALNQTGYPLERMGEGLAIRSMFGMKSNYEYYTIYGSAILAQLIMTSDSRHPIHEFYFMPTTMEDWAFGLQKGSPLTALLSYAKQDAAKSGLLKAVKQRYLKETDSIVEYVTQNTPISLQVFGGTMLLLVIGTGISLHCTTGTGTGSSLGAELGTGSSLGAEILLHVTTVAVSVAETNERVTVLGKFTR